LLFRVDLNLTTADAQFVASISAQVEIDWPRAALSLSVATFGSGVMPDQDIADRIKRLSEFGPAAIVDRFGLRIQPALKGERGFYRPLAVYGHFGCTDLDLPWEATDLVDALHRCG
jgi:S-adenosylmethionine synthetase